MRSDRLRAFAPALAWLCVSFAASHAAMEAACRFVESRGAYLWHREEFLQLFTPSNWRGRGAGRVLLCGPSEAREALRHDVIADELGLEAYQASQSWGTLEDLVVMLEYVARAHGEDALPDRLVIGATPRWLSGHGLELSPTLHYVDRHSPRFAVERGDGPPRLVEKGIAASIVSRWRHRTHMSPRYENALRAIVREALSAVGGERFADLFAERLEPYRFARRARRPVELVRRFVEEPRGLWRDVRTWDARSDRERIRGLLDRLRAVLEPAGTRVLVVNLPVRPAARSFYDDELYAAYVRVLREELGEIPLFDLGAELGDAAFFDSVHVTREGAVRVTKLVARELSRSAVPASVPTPEGER